MSYVNYRDKQNWGNQFKERKNSFDDSADIERLKEFGHDIPFCKHIRQYLDVTEDESLSWRPKFYGDYDVDLTLVNEEGEPVANFDVERWYQWKDDWPRYYRYISFLERKEKFLGRDVPFFMCWFSNDFSRLLVVEESDIKKYPTQTVNFKSGHIDRVKKIGYNDGYIFGNPTITERRMFN